LLAAMLSMTGASDVDPTTAMLMQAALVMSQGGVDGTGMDPMALSLALAASGLLPVMPQAPDQSDQDYEEADADGGQPHPTPAASIYMAANAPEFVPTNFAHTAADHTTARGTVLLRSTSLESDPPLIPFEYPFSNSPGTFPGGLSMHPPRADSFASHGDVTDAMYPGGMALLPSSLVADSPPRAGSLYPTLGMPIALSALWSGPGSFGVQPIAPQFQPAEQPKPVAPPVAQPSSAPAANPWKKGGKESAASKLFKSGKAEAPLPIAGSGASTAPTNTTQAGTPAPVSAPAAPASVPEVAPVDPVEAHRTKIQNNIRKANKKLREIADLEKLPELDAAQQKKVQLKDTLKQEIAALELELRS
jgi:hypothetical protein